MKFNPINKNTNLDNVEMHQYQWDINIKDQDYSCYNIPNYKHTNGGHWGENCLYVCPRDEEPTPDNLIPFNSNYTCRWGFSVNENNYIDSHYGDKCVAGIVEVTILRNNTPFENRRFRDMSYAIAWAQKYIIDVQEGMFDVNSRDFKYKYIGHKVWYKEVPAKIEAFSLTGANVYIKADNETGLFPMPESWKNDWSEEKWNRHYGEGIMISIDDENLRWR